MNQTKLTNRISPLIDLDSNVTKTDFEMHNSEITRKIWEGMKMKQSAFVNIPSLLCIW